MNGMGVGLDGTFGCWKGLRFLALLPEVGCSKLVLSGEGRAGTH